MVFKTDYEKEYIDFDRLDAEVRNHRARFDTITEFIYSGDLGTLLDVGAGTGILARNLRGRNYPSPILNCDINASYVTRLQADGLTAVKADLHELPFKDREFDIVTCNEVVEHLADPGKAISELLRVTKKRMIMTLPCKRVEDEFHGWLIKASIIDSWLVLEWERRAGNE